MAPRVGKREDIMSADISFDLKRLFDPYNFDHIPREERLGLFKQRDLPHIKHYKAAVKIFGGPPRRTRAIVAPPMETPLKHRLGLYMSRTEPPPSVVLNGPLKPPPEPIKELSEEEKERNKEIKKTSDYKSWMIERQKLRNNLNGLALNEAMLARKPNKTELEKRVEAKFKADRTWKPETPPPKDETPPPKPAPDIPVMNIPPPDGLQILDKFLSLNRMRLIDLFKITDKDKSWSLSRTEFLNAVAKSALPISEGEVDDMFIALDSDLDEELNFSELNQGLLQWRKQRRGLKKNSLDEVSQNTNGKESSSNTTYPGGTPAKPGSIQSRKSSKYSSRGTVEKPALHEETPTIKSPKSPQIKLALHSEKSQESIIQGKTSSQGTIPMSREDKSHETNSEGKNREVNSGSFPKSRESSTKIPSSKESNSKSHLETPREIAFESFPSNQHRVKIVDVPTTAESSLQDVAQDEQADKSLYEDVLFQSSDSPKATDGGKESDEDDRVDSKTHTSTDKSIRPGSRKAGTPNSDTRSWASTPNSLEPPEFDTTRTESRAPESAEAMLDIRKHDRVVLSRNAIRKNLSRDKRVTFDELPGVIKVGYKPIDDHCTDSTLGGEAAGLVNQFRQEKLREYFEVQKLFEERGIPMTHKTLDRVLLYPGDRSIHVLRKEIALPLGPLTDEHSPFNQPKPKKKNTKRRRGLAGRLAKASRQNAGQNINSAGGNSEDGGGSASSKRSLITVEDVYPFASTVTPKVYKENLSSGRALITRKVDNWMTFEEYTKYTEHLPNRFGHFNRPSNPDTAWPGYVLDKVRLCMPPYDDFVDGSGRPIKNRDSNVYEGLGTGLYNGMGSAVFRSTGQRKLAYPGYNNDLLTWPVGPNGVRYGNIDEHRIIK